MAANNFFGFPHGGTQYGGAGAGAAYAGGQAGYAVAGAAPPATYSAPRPAPAYEATAYQAAATQGSYAAAGGQPGTYQLTYGRSAAQQTYDASKTAYYQQAAAAAAAYPAQQQPAYEAAQAKPAYTATPTYAQAPAARATAPAKGAQYTETTASTTYSGYDAALYSAATMYVAQQNKGAGASSGNAGWQGYRKGGNAAGGARLRPKPPPKPQQLHYCDVCRISCAGPQTYREHLEGQKHKRKEASMKAAASGAGSNGGGHGGGNGNSLRCELCDVPCTGNDAYAAHVRGIKHQKVVKLHTRLGKPIPSQEPKVVGAKIKFVSSGGLSTVGGDPDASADNDTTAEEIIEEPEIQPVGQDYIEEIKGDDGKVLSFNCKLCDCRFNDPNAKEMHMKGRRHRLQYKKKVQPDLVVDVKPSLRQRKLPGQKMQRMMDEMWARRRMHKFMPVMNRRPESRDDRHIAAHHAEIYPAEEELEAIQRVVSHTERALKSVSDSLTEQALKQQSKTNKPVVVVVPPPPPVVVVAPKVEKTEEKPAANGEKKEETADPKEAPKEDGRDNQLFSFLQEGEATGASNVIRLLKGVMRVGLLAKGLLLKGDRSVRLVVLCADKPTVSLLKRVAQELPQHLVKVTEEYKYKVELCPAEGAVSITDGNITVLVSLTSPVMREPTDVGGSADAPKRDDKDVLPRQKCLDALASLRHAKWFQARASGLQSCVIVIRIMRDLCRRVPTWTPLNSWAMELLVEKVTSSAGAPLSPGECLRRVIEAVAGGILLENGPGLLDPCEKDHQDALGNMPPQKREDLTASAQQFLRQVAFNQIHKVLDMDPMPQWPSLKRKRSSDEAEGDGKMTKMEVQEKMDISETGTSIKAEPN